MHGTTNIKFLKDVPMIYVNFIIIVITVSEKTQEAFLLYQLLYTVISKVVTLTHVQELSLALQPTHLYIHWTKGSSPLNNKMGIEGDHSHPHKVDMSGQIYLLLDRDKWSVSHPQYVMPHPGRTTNQ